MRGNMSGPIVIDGKFSLDRLLASGKKLVKVSVCALIIVVRVMVFQLHGGKKKRKLFYHGWKNSVSTGSFQAADH